MKKKSRMPLTSVALLVLFIWLAWRTFVQPVPRGNRMWRPPATPDAVAAPATTDLPAPAPGTSVVVRAAGALSAEESNTIALYRELSPSVVSVANRALVRGGLFGFQIFEVPQGAGSGFVWDRKGHIISNYHVIHQASAVSVTFPDGSRYEAELVGVAPDHDLAVLRVEAPAEKLVPLRIGLSRDLQVGQSVLAIGNPFGLDTTLTVGIVSALGRTIMAMTERRIQDVIQTDAAINPGNSGGPLLNSRGELIGINTAILSPSGAYAGIGFAVPVDTVARVVPQLIEKGRVSRAGLGVELLPDHAMRRAGLQGAAILNVAPGGPAAAAGLRGVAQTREGHLVLGDVIVAIGEQAVTCVDDLSAALDRHQPGESVTVSSLRDRERHSVSVRLQAVD